MPSALLDLLRKHRGQWLTLDTVHNTLTLPTDRISSRLDRLRTMGYRIETDATRGMRLCPEFDDLDPDLIKRDLNTKRIGRKILIYECPDSTNDIAWNHATEPDHDGLAVFAEQQNKGRGRLGRTWLAPRASSLLGSVLLHNSPPIAPQTLTLLAGLATAQAIEKLTPRLTPRIKWPNDVIINSRKVAGTIIESRQTPHGTAYVIGIGINCQQKLADFEPEIRDIATSLRILTAAAVDRQQLAQHLLRSLDHWIALVSQGQVKKLHHDWLRYCDDIGRFVTLICNGQRFAGRIVDVAPDKGLLLQIEHGPVKVFQAATTTVERETHWTNP